MDSLRIVDGRLWSGHFVYVRDARALSNSEFLDALGLRGYTLDTQPRFPCHCAHVMRASDWTGYADDWLYTAYNSAGFGDAVSRLGRRYELLRIAIGDADQSFEFYYFLRGSLHRGFHFHDYAGRSSVMLDSGSPLRCESAFSLGSDPWPFLCAIVDEIGIDSRAMTESVSTYSKPYQRR
jgi:hypothetical protein